MTAMTPKGIVADTSYPAAAQTREEQGPKNWAGVDFLWAEDALFAWRAAAVFGGLLVITGFLYWLGATDYGGFTLAPFIALAAFCLFGAAFSAFLGRTEAALALLVLLVVAGALAFFDPPALLPYPSALFGGGSAVAPDLETVLALWAAGAAVLFVGVVQSVRTAHSIDDDE